MFFCSLNKFAMISKFFFGGINSIQLFWISLHPNTTSQVIMLESMALQ